MKRTRAGAARSWLHDETYKIIKRAGFSQLSIPRKVRLFDKLVVDACNAQFSVYRVKNDIRRILAKDDACHHRL